MVERIGNCRVIGEIGSGGMAVIYKAVQESLNRTVAIKALKSTVAKESQFAVRFEREALSVSALQHENIIHVYDFHKEADGPSYIVMEYVEGIDLYDLLERCQRLPAEVAAIIAMNVARGLDYAHYRGVIHRDIKPANIMIGKSGAVKLMDFGIARDQAFSDLTESGTGVGTPSYMSPEQILGDRLDFRSDHFSLGIVLYQMLAGKKPFIEDEKKSVMNKIRLERPPTLRQCGVSVPRELERILARCLEKRKQERYESTQDLVLALERFISRRVDINYHARLVLFLRDRGLLSAEEAEAQLHPAIAGGYRPFKLPGPLGSSRMRRLASVQAAILGVMALALAFVHVSQLGVPPSPPPRAAAPAPAGYLHVVVDPWAEVYVDGRYADTTPFAKALPLSEGAHQVLLKNPHYAAATRRVEIARGAVSTLQVELERR